MIHRAPSERLPYRRSRRRNKATASEISRGLFVHTGVMELMTRGNERAIANVGFVIEADALVLIDTGRRCSRGLMRREIVWIGMVRPRTTARLRNISLPLRPERVADH